MTRSGIMMDEDSHLAYPLLDLLDYMVGQTRSKTSYRRLTVRPERETSGDIYGCRAELMSRRQPPPRDPVLK
jgi:hypothetical protein